ncbi:unnamed protein product [Aureobasidium pullulans]|nr:unnamed protein product [Aureobasidium pullulans]
MPSQISEQIHRPKNITRKDIACFANAQQKPKLYSTNHSIAKDQNQMEMENKRKRSSNGKFSLACWDNLVSDPDTGTRVMLDASIRRFKIQQIYLKASAALRWLTSRNAILGGNRPQPIHTPALQQIANTMRAELASVTPARVELALRSQDSIQGKWLAEDPTWSTMEQSIRTGR